MTTQQAYRLHGYEGVHQHTLDTIPVPKPGQGQVLVEVSFVGVNPFDWKLRDGYMKEFVPLQLPAILGVEVVGKIAELGEGVTSFAVGERVMAMDQHLGGYAQFKVTDEENLAKVPDNIDDETAITLPVAALTAAQTLYAAGDVKPGSKILIHGASGAVGSLAVQLAKATGATVIGTASAKNKQYVLDLGADQVIDYKNEKFEDLVHDVDIVLDYVLVGGVDSTTDRSWSVLKQGGAFITAADPSALHQIPEGKRAFWPTIDTSGTLLEPYSKQLAAGTIKTKIAKVYGLAKVNEAIDASKAGGLNGRLLIDVKQV